MSLSSLPDSVSCKAQHVALTLWQSSCHSDGLSHPSLLFSVRQESYLATLGHGECTPGLSRIKRFGPYDGAHCNELGFSPTAVVPGNPAEKHSHGD